MKYQSTYYNKSKKEEKKRPLLTDDAVTPSPSEKIAREELLKLIQNSEEIKNIKKQIEKESGSKKLSN